MTHPPSGAPSGLGFDTRAGRLQVTLGAQQLDAGPMAPSLDVTLIDGLQAVLEGRAVAGGQHRLALDRAGTRRLGVRHRPGGLELSLLDIDGRPLIPSLPLPLAGFARAVQAFVGRGETPHARHADLHALVDWAEALDDVPASGPSRGGTASRDADGSPPADRVEQATGSGIPAARLPVDTLYHLAYRRAWRHEAPGLSAVAADAERVAVFDGDGLTLLDRTTGEITQAHAGLRPLGGPAPMCTAADPEERPVLLDGQARIRWRGPAPLGDAPLQTLHPGTPCALAVTAGREAYGLDAASGRRLWRYQTHHGEILGATTRGEVAWLTAEDGFVHGLDLAQGARRFAVSPPGRLDGPPRLTAFGLLIALDDAGGPGSRLTCLDPLDGGIRWSTALPGHLGCAPVPDAEGLIAVVEIGADPAAIALDARGAIVWQRPLDGPDLPVIHGLDASVYCKHIDGALTALDRASGALLWVLPGDDPELMLRFNPPPVACRGLLLVPGTTIRAVDPGDGRVVHRIDCDELVPDRLHVWHGGDLAIAEHDAVARYLLGGHLALVR